MKSSKRAVNWFMRLRRSSKPKLIEGSWPAMDGASCEGARILALREDSKVIMLIVEVGATMIEKPKVGRQSVWRGAVRCGGCLGGIAK